MNISCPNCHTTFRVDPARIPATGIRARCSRCGTSFHIAASGAQHNAAPAAATATAPASAAAAHPAPGTPTGAVPVAPSRPPAPAAPAPGSAAETGMAARPATFGSRDPNARAQRIARALVSDIIAYHPKRWENAHAAGTLRNEFREEIMKSWEEYVAQVGLDLARSTPHFRSALNDILARGQQVF